MAAQRRRTAASAAARVATLLLLALAPAGCGLFGPAIELPKNPAEAAANPAVGARALMRANQLELELATWQPAIQSLVDAPGDALEPSRAQPLRAAVRRVYGAQRLYDRVATSLSDDWDGEAALAQLQFLGSSVGKKLLRARALRRDSKTMERFRDFSRGFAESQFPPARVELLRRLDRALLTSKSAVLVNRARAARQEPQLYEMAADELLRWDLFAFESLSDDELSRYVDFAESPAGQWWVVSSARALRMAANGAGEELFQALRPRNDL
jgi:hypothetical protein